MWESEWLPVSRGGTSHWRVLSPFELRPKLTFFGLDKNESHCFTLRKGVTSEIMEDGMREILGFVGDELQTKVKLIIGGNEFPATLRMINQDRSRTRTRGPGELPMRLVHNISWKGEEDTIGEMRELNWKAYDSVKRGDLKHPWNVTFNHLGKGEFLVRSNVNNANQ
tara:strand:- start:661 stop:1161 length:501 start_codon:yes stop_codon:yes gene_type:complete